MFINTKAIVLHSFRYQDKSLIVKCFTQKEGLSTFFVKNAFSKSKTQNMAYFQPLTLLDIHYKEKKANSLNYFHQVHLSQPYRTITSDFNKSVVVMFLAEILNSVVQENQENEELFVFLEHSLLWYDTCNWNADFHIFVLFQITKYLGFHPDDSYHNELYFNKREGYFTNDFQYDCYNEEETLLFKKGLSIELGKSSSLNGVERKQILQLILDYFQTHLHQLKTINSLQVVSELY